MYEPFDGLNQTCASESRGGRCNGLILNSNRDNPPVDESASLAQQKCCASILFLQMIRFFRLVVKCDPNAWTPPFKPVGSYQSPQNSGYGSNKMQKVLVRACQSCHKSHLSCEVERPCNRCQLKGIECVDRPITKRKRKSVHVYPEPSFQLFDDYEEPNSDPNNGLYSYLFPQLDQLDYINNALQGTPLSDDIYSEPITQLETPSTNPFTPSSLAFAALLEEPPQMNPITQYNMQQQQPPPNDNEGSSRGPPLRLSDNHGVPPSFRMFDVQNTMGMIEHMDIRGNVQAMMDAIGKYLEKVKKLEQWITPQQKQELITEYNRQMNDLKNGADQSEFPVIIFGSKGRIFHVNIPFREETGWNQPTPTRPEDHAFFQVLAPETMYQVHLRMPEIILGSGKRHVLNGAFKRYGTNMYIHGQIAISIKRDIFSLPQLYMLHFVPSEQPYEEVAGSSPYENQRTV
ncbi:hypothetical protein PROFUN_06775 [Planoprotostelium fungivorum]|uniref:Zn(2)-C6 fungal-type domain-containing protein n=1 Tax=Planoprotostelium fungivorum TaxID=1890364 RepID=A0A2P6NNL0_9EUKA|nr:hypothetical protein PROFUN_06775 [Planoprotostelium fungivorum]